MAALSKKKADKKPRASFSPWHPNFRNVQELPDIKVVRTTFFINGLALFVAVSLLLITVIREYKILSLKHDLGLIEKQIEENKPESDKVVALYKKFQAEETKATFTADFADKGYDIGSFILSIGKILPQKVIISSVDYRPDMIVLSGQLQDEDFEKASLGAEEVVKLLREDEKISKPFETIHITRLARLGQEGRMSMEIACEFPKPKKAAKGKK